METEIKMKKRADNIGSLRNGLNSLIKRTTENEIANQLIRIYYYCYVTGILLRYV